MKKKLVSLLLALVMCMGLAVPAFAEEGEELPMPEETILLPEGGTEGTAPDMDFYQQVMAMVDELDIELDADIIDTENSDPHICFAEYDEDKDYIGRAYQMINGDVEQHKVYEEYMGHCTGCKKMIIVSKFIGTGNHSLHKSEVRGYRQGDDNVHEASNIYACHWCGITLLKLETEPHSWTKKSRYQTNATTHTLMYDYSCGVCGATKTETGATASHSMDYDGYKGDNYHKGTLHYVGYQYHCTVCGYIKTQYASTPCPGNDKGEGCIFSTVNGVEPPDEELEAAPAKEVTGTGEAEVLPAEEAPVLPDPVEEEVHEHEEDGYAVFSWGTSDLIWTEVETEEIGENTVRTVYDVCRAYGQAPMSADIFSAASTQASPGNCDRCGKNNWGPGTPMDTDYENVTSSKHTRIEATAYLCKTTDCFMNGVGLVIQTRTVESHSMDYDGYQGSNYHKGAFHYIGYQYRCVCGYTETRYDSVRCPGNDKGEGCIFSIVNGVEPPDEELEAAPVEEEEFAEAEYEHRHWLANCDIEVAAPEGHTATVTFWAPCDGSCQDEMLATAPSMTAAQATWPCANCKQVNWDNGKVKSVVLVNLNDEDVHGVDAVVLFECQTCHITADYKDKWSEPHSWTKNSRYQSNASTHTLMYDYSCVCGKTKTERGASPESHSMDYDGYKGSNYHKGAFHYVGYQYHCTVCGYIKTQYASTPCPGNDKGEGCIFSVVNGVEPPDEELETTPAEEVTEPEETTEPGEVTEPEKTIEPEEIIEPEDVTEPEEADIPEEVDAPEEPIEPEEPTIPEESTAPGETDVPEEGESLE